MNGASPGPTSNGKFYHDAVYNILRDTNIHGSTSITLKKLKAKILRLHHMAQHRIFLNTNEHDRIVDEEASLCHILKLRKRHESRMIYRVHDSHDNSQMASIAVLCTSTEFLRGKYDNIQEDDESGAW